MEVREEMVRSSAVPCNCILAMNGVWTVSSDLEIKNEGWLDSTLRERGNGERSKEDSDTHTLSASLSKCECVSSQGTVYDGRARLRSAVKQVGKEDIIGARGSAVPRPFQ
jgi:hypothetical protein